MVNTRGKGAVSEESSGEETGTVYWPKKILIKLEVRERQQLRHSELLTEMRQQTACIKEMGKQVSVSNDQKCN